MTLIRITYLFLISLFFASCVTTKVSVETELTKQKEPQNLLSKEEEREFEYLFIEGIKQKKLGKQQAAVSLFSRCLEIDPNSALVMYKLAELHFANKDLTSAALLLEKAIEIIEKEPEVSPKHRWYQYMYIQVLHQQKKFAKAAEILEQLHQNDPENLEYLYQLAITHAAARQYEEAIEAYNKLEQKTGLNEQISVAKRQIYANWEKPEKAIEEINKLIDSNPKEPRYYGLLAEMYQSQGDMDNALKYYQKILEIEPDNGFVHFSFAGYYIEKGDKEKAFEHIEKAFASKELEADTKIQYYMLQTADPKNAEWDNKQIESLLNTLYRTHPDDNRMYTIFAEYLIRQEKLIEAKEYLQKYLETDQSNFIIWQQMIFISNDLLDFESVYTDTQKAIELFPNQSVLYALNAVACLQLEKYQEALDILAAGEPYVLDNQQMKIQFELYKAEANYKLGNVEQAFKAFDEVIRLDPDNYIAMNNYAYYLSLRGEKLDKAERLSGKVVQENPDNPTYLDTYAWVLFKRKDYQLARFYIESAINKGGDTNPVLVEHYGDILYMLGEKEKAIEKWRKAVELGDGSAVLEQKVKELRYIEEKEGL